ncbi:hypothetical protein [Methanosarcina barkeri]|nr:hypothetical protein [Methanosarcina barkeri]
MQKEFVENMWLQDKSVYGNIIEKYVAVLVLSLMLFFVIAK